MTSVTPLPMTATAALLRVGIERSQQLAREAVLADDSAALSRLTEGTRAITGSLVRLITAQIAELEREARAAFVADRIAKLAPDARPDAAGRGEIDRRLREATEAGAEFFLAALHWPHPVDAGTAAQLVARELKAIWEDVTTRAFADAPIAEDEEAEPWAAVLLGREPRSLHALATVPPPYLHNGLLHRVHLAYVWPEVFREWREEHPEGTFRAPTALVAGPQSAATLFGKRHRDRAEIRTIVGGRRSRVVSLLVDANRSQTELFLAEQAELVDPKEAEVLQLIASVLDNATFRYLLCCFAAAQEDEERLGVQGAFLYTPSRFADLHGMPRERVSGRHEHERYRAMDARRAALMRMGMRLTVKQGGKERTVEVERVIVDGCGTITATEGPRRGRRTLRLFHVNAFLLALMNKAEGGSYFAVPRTALAAPEGVDQRRWDDCFKLLLLLLAHARYDRKRATQGRLWARDFDDLLHRANIAGHGVPQRHARERGRVLLETLADAGLLRGVRIDSDGGKTMLRYGLPSSQAAALAGIRARQAPCLDTPVRRKRSG